MDGRANSQAYLERVYPSIGGFYLVMVAHNKRLYRLSNRGELDETTVRSFRVVVIESFQPSECNVAGTRGNARQRSDQYSRTETKGRADFDATHLASARALRIGRL